MTTRLYLDDPDLLAFDAQLLDVSTLAGRPAALLDQTAFHPEGGGQPADQGRLGGVEVIDVQEVAGQILHVLAEALVPGPVHGEVDAARRRDHLQQHHGQHLLSAAFATLGASTVSFHLGAETCTIDLDLPPARLEPDVLRRAEAVANDLVARNLPVTARTYRDDELASLPLRKEPAKGSRVVVVSDEGRIVDASPCGGTHPRRTGTVGAIAILRATKWGSGTRVEFVCGQRVVRALTAANRTLGDAAAALRCAPPEVPAAVARVVEEASSRRKEQDRLLLALADAEGERLAARTPAGAVHAVVTPPASGAPAYARAVAAALASRGRTAFVGAVEEGRGHLAFARPKGPGPHLGERVRAAAAALGGKGGGAPDAATGSGPDVARLEAILEEAARAP